jgi:hypothetical protein
MLYERIVSELSAALAMHRDVVDSMEAEKTTMEKYIRNRFHLEAAIFHIRCLTKPCSMEYQEDPVKDPTDVKPYEEG